MLSISGQQRQTVPICIVEGKVEFTLNKHWMEKYRDVGKQRKVRARDHKSDGTQR